MQIAPAAPAVPRLVPVRAVGLLASCARSREKPRPLRPTRPCSTFAVTALWLPRGDGQSGTQGTQGTHPLRPRATTSPGARQATPRRAAPPALLSRGARAVVSPAVTSRVPRVPRVPPLSESAGSGPSSEAAVGAPPSTTMSSASAGCSPEELSRVSCWSAALLPKRQRGRAAPMATWRARCAAWRYSCSRLSAAVCAAERGTGRPFGTRVGASGACPGRRAGLQVSDQGSSNPMSCVTSDAVDLSDGATSRAANGSVTAAGYIHHAIRPTAPSPQLRSRRPLASSPGARTCSLPS